MIELVKECRIQDFHRTHKVGNVGVSANLISFVNSVLFVSLKSDYFILGNIYISVCNLDYQNFK